MGRDWYENGKLLNKRNTFNDFIDVTKHLVAAKYADPKRVFAEGRSAGGLLIGAVSNLAPELYSGLIVEVPFVDVVTTMSDPEGRFAIEGLRPGSYYVRITFIGYVTKTISDVTIRPDAWSANVGEVNDDSPRGMAQVRDGAESLEVLVVVRDACFSMRGNNHDFFMERVFPRMARVRSVDETVALMETQ